MNFSRRDQVSLYFIGIQESDELGEVGKGGNFITEPCTCQWDTKYYKHLFIREFSSLCNAVHGTYFQYILTMMLLFWTSQSILKFHLTPPWDSLLVLSDLLFWFSSSIFIAFPLISVKSLRDSSEDLLLAIFLLRGTKNIFFKPFLALRRGRLRPVQSVFFLPGVCFTNFSNDRAWGKLHGDNCRYWGNCPGAVSSDHSRKAHRRTGVIAVSMGARRWGQG